MSNLVKVFINQNGEVNTYCKGRLASVEDLENQLCETGEVISGVLQLEDGQYYYQSAEQQRKILMLDEDITEEELEECSGEYVKVNSEVSTLYKFFIADLDEVLEEVLTVNYDEDDEMLVATSRLYNSKFIHTHNYFYKDGEIVKKTVMIPTVMLGLSLYNISLESLV